LADLTLAAVNISRIAQDLIIWSSPDFAIVELPESFAFTSSIMPQKKNPDVLEVIRARMNNVSGNLFVATTIMTALPSGYNLDFQEITPKLWDSIQTVAASVHMLSELFPNLEIKSNIFKKQVLKFATTTELANVLVKNYAVPFRTAHKIVGAVVKELLDNNLTLSDLTPEQLNKTAQECAEIILDVKLADIKQATDPKMFVESHKTKGGPAPEEVKRMLNSRKQVTAKTKTTLTNKKGELAAADIKLNIAVKRCLSN
jgi:argininosuccinate lyase